MISGGMGGKDSIQARNRSWTSKAADQEAIALLVARCRRRWVVGGRMDGVGEDD
jgi:hypothetical protein